MTDPAKTFDETIRAAFFAGVRFGVRYPEEQSIPSGEAEIQYRAWRDSLAGNIWSPQMWLQARVDAGLVLIDRSECNDRCYGEPCVHKPIRRDASLGERMGHVGGHYG